MSGYVRRPAKRIDNSKGRVFRGREEILKCLGNEQATVGALCWRPIRESVRRRCVVSWKSSSRI